MSRSANTPPRPSQHRASAAATPSSSSDSAYLQAPLVKQLASSGAVQGLRVVVSADSGAPGNSSALIAGTNATGDQCWTVVAGGGGVGGPFQCGSQVGSEPGETAAEQLLRAGCQTSGGPESTTASAASCIGFVGQNVTKIAVSLAGGSSQTLAVTDGAFAYAADSPDLLPVAFVAYGSDGSVLARQDVSLSGGP